MKFTNQIFTGWIEGTWNVQMEANNRLNVVEKEFLEHWKWIFLRFRKNRKCFGTVVFSVDQTKRMNTIQSNPIKSETELTVLVCDMVTWHDEHIVCFGKYGMPTMLRSHEQSEVRQLDAMWIRCFYARNCSFPPIVEYDPRWRCLLFGV